MLDIFSYTDYRKFLQDFYTEKKSEQKNFSHRYIAQKVGFQSSGYFSKILQAKVNISIDMIIKLIDFLKLRKKEAAYFEQLVLYNQAKSRSEKKHHFEKLIKFKDSKIKLVSGGQYEYFDKWYHIAIRELLNFYSFKGDFKELGSQLSPPISEKEAKKTIDLLLKLKLISKKPKGIYQLTDNLITTGFEGNLMAINNYQLAAMDLGKAAVDSFPREERGISTLTVSCSEDTYGEIQNRINSFRRELMDLVHKGSNPERIYQINMQLFPLSVSSKEKKK